ncbi:MAG: aminotransferase class IV [Flavobacteriales bacterium]|nr:aminotransferase class IV [Flavobacteriales bacterium]
MMRQVILNGRLVEGDPPLMPVDNRAFHYGDGVFETIRVIGGRGQLLEAHWARLAASLAVLGIRMPEKLTAELLDRYVSDLAQRGGGAGGRARLTVYRDAPGFYRPDADAGAFTLEYEPLAEMTYTLNEQGVMVDIYPDMRKPVNQLAVHKTLNALLYVMASLWAKGRGLDDCLLQNDRGNIIESSSGNLFMVSNSVLYTPALTDGCVGGVMRMRVINLALAGGIKVYECSLNPQNLLAADEVFFTNAARGITWAAAYRTKRYTQRMAQRITAMLVEGVS